MIATLALCANVIRESVRRRLFVILAIASLIYCALYGVGLALLNQHADQIGAPGGDAIGSDSHALIAVTLFAVGMFAMNFLANVLAVFLTLSTVATEADRGVLQPLVVRPIGRAQLLLSRWLGAALVCGLYALVLYAITLVLTRVITGWHPAHEFRPGLDLALATWVISGLSILGSIRLTFVANGIAVIMLFGLGQLGGLLGQIGSSLNNGTLVHVGHDVAWAVPYEAMYQQGLNDLSSGATGLVGFVVQLGPLGGAQNGGAKLVLWTAAYIVVTMAIAIAAFRRKDL